MQVPQFMMPPHPSPSIPQFAPRTAHVTAVHGGFSQLLGLLGSAPQSWPAGQETPHWMMPPHPSLAGPQS
jgi:hypothetical protein